MISWVSSLQTSLDILTLFKKVYFPHLLAPLLRSLIDITSPPFVSISDPPEVIISYEIRSLIKESPFWSAFGLWFSFRPLLFRSTSPLGKASSVTSEDEPEQSTQWRRFGSHIQSDGPSFVFIAYRKEESYAWAVPDDDSKLLKGVGSMGNSLEKSDCTFESLLQMTMDSDWLIVLCPGKWLNPLVFLRKFGGDLTIQTLELSADAKERSRKLIQSVLLCLPLMGTSTGLYCFASTANYCVCSSISHNITLLTLPLFGLSCIARTQHSDKKPFTRKNKSWKLWGEENPWFSQSETLVLSTSESCAIAYQENIPAQNQFSHYTDSWEKHHIPELLSV